MDSAPGAKSSAEDERPQAIDDFRKDAINQIRSILDAYLGAPGGEALTAKQIYANRQMRQKFFPASLFSEPAWDMLLDLFIAHEEGRKLQTTAAAIGSQKPLTTALRWIAILEDNGLVRRYQDDEDHRCTYVEISEDGLERMKGFLASRANKPATPVNEAS